MKRNAPRVVLNIFTWRRLTKIAEEAIFHEVAAESSVLGFADRARQEHRENRDILVVVLRPLNALSADGLRA